MLRRLQAFLVLGVCTVALPAAAQDPTEEAATPPATDAESPGKPAAPSDTAASPSDAKPADASKEESPPSPPGTPEEDEANAPVKASDEKPARGWDTFASGYFRAPVALGISPRPGPDDPNGPDRLQVSYGPTRTLDANYYSFAYTRLQEQDWAEVFLHAKKKHVEAVVGWMGYWFGSAGFRNYDAAWVPGMAYLTLDTDVNVGKIKPNIALTAGAWWPKFGYIEKYDTFTLGQFRQVGEQLQFTIPFNDDLTLTLVQGFGTGRDGSWNIQFPQPYQAVVGIDLLHYEHIRLQYKKLVDIGLHFNHQWTRDPNLWQQGGRGTSYADARDAKFTTFGAEAAFSAPRAGRLWVSPSYTRVRNGWALSSAGTEVVHSLSGNGFVRNYLAFDESVINSTGTGSSFNLGFVYENSLSTVLAKEEKTAPDVSLAVFGLMVDASLDLPEGTRLTQDRIAQMKYGADVTVQATNWMAVMLRWDEINYDLDHPGYVFSAITPRVTFATHFLSSESFYIQYSRYRYGDHMTLAGKWPWGQFLIPGSTYTQGGPYTGDKPDMDVIKFQASVAF